MTGSVVGGRGISASPPARGIVCPGHGLLVELRFRPPRCSIVFGLPAYGYRVDQRCAGSAAGRLWRGLWPGD